MATDYKESLNNLLKGLQLILVSNRGPYTFECQKNGNLEKLRGGGGLISAFLSLLNDVNVTWLSIARSKVDSEIGLKGIKIGPKEQSAAKFLSFDKKIYSSYYNDMCNEVFWFVQHSLIDEHIRKMLEKKKNVAWESYRKVNKRFGEAISKEISLRKEDKTIVLFQDYHQYLAAKYLSKDETVLSSHFTHVPWPAPEIISALPKQMLREIIEGLLNNNLVVFHCEEYVRNFLNTCHEILGLEIDKTEALVAGNKGWVPIKAFPISIDSLALTEESNMSKVRSYESAIRSKKKLIFRADRIDPCKNIIRGFLAFEKMLELFPSFRNKVTFMAYLYESRTDLKRYKKYLVDVKKTVKAINNRFGTEDWKPIQLRLADNYYQTLAAYKHFDVLLVNSIADGMNLVAKEGTLLNENNGVLVLSKKTGAYNELKKYCITVDPYDIKGTAISLKEALAMPEKERTTRSDLMKQKIKVNNSTRWIYNQIDSIVGQAKDSQIQKLRLN